MRKAKWLALAAAVVALHAQVPDQIRKATIRGSKGTSGKCTIEVRVDIAAEVDIYGDSGRLRTLGGPPATWTRMECTDPLPYNMTDFRFTGVDGRGQQRLLQDPRNNNGMAVIRIDDPKGGSEGYTFDIEWSGASGGAPVDGFSNPRDMGRRPGRNFPGRWSDRAISAEQAIDLCRTEVRTRAARDYNLRDIDITAAAVDTTTGRNDRITGAFSEPAARFRRTAGYRFNCAVDFNAGRVTGVELLRGDGTAIQPGSGYNQGSYDQNRVLRACQDAVAARVNRDGYEGLRFASTAVDPNRTGSVSGTFSATRGPVGDTFDFRCSMDLSSATVRDVQLNRR